MGKDRAQKSGLIPNFQFNSKLPVNPGVFFWETLKALEGRENDESGGEPLQSVEKSILERHTFPIGTSGC